MQKVKAPSAWKSLPYQQVSDDAVWEITRNFNCFLFSNNGLTLSKDPCNLTGLNTKRDSGLANTRAIGIGYETTERKVREKKAKKKARVVRFSLRVRTHRQIPKKRLVALPAKTLPLHNNTVFAERRRITTRSVAKTLLRDLKNYRSDLLPLAFRRLNKLHRFKRLNKRLNKLEAKKVKA
jgi:hypothetical protein